MSVFVRLSAGLSLAGSLVVAHAGEVEDTIRKQLLALQPDLKVEDVAATPKAGLYQVRLRGGQILYADQKAEFLLHGDLYQVAEGQAVNLTEQARQQQTAALMQDLNPADMVVFPAVAKKAAITVFTDVDCGYCQKLHQEVEALNAAGIEVRYLAWPRQGLTGPTYDTMVSVWCAEDRQQAMTRAKKRELVAATQCRHPVDRQFALGRQLGIQGTPAIVLESGELLPGYLPAEQLIARALGATP